MNPKFTFVLNYFRQIYDVPEDVEIGYGKDECKINIHACQTSFYETCEPFPEELIVWKDWKQRKLPFLFANTPSPPVLEINQDKAVIHYDILAASFFFLSGWQEYVYMSKQAALRYPFSVSLQSKLKIIHLPVVNYYFDILKTAIERVYHLSLSVRAWEDNPFGICLTHDIDKCNTGWRQDSFSELKQRRLSSFLKIAARGLRGKDTCFNFDDIMKLENEFSANSSFYFIPRKGSVYLNPRHLNQKKNNKKEITGKVAGQQHFFRSGALSRFRGYTVKEHNADYDIRSIKIHKVFETILNNGSEVGVHGSFGSHIKLDHLKDDINRFPFEIYGGRFHFLCFNITRTFDYLEELQIKYDSTIGFAEQPGFRNGIAFPYVPYNIRENRPYNLLEIPLVVMDTTFRTYTKTPREEILPDILSLINEVQQFNGCLTVLWHNAYFTPYKFYGWREIYRELLKEGKKRRALLISGKQVYERWKSILTIT